MSTVFLLCLVALAAAAPPDKEIPIVAYENDVGFDGTYKYSYESGDGTKVQESGKLSGENEAVSGSFSYVGVDGVTYTITYTADENGFVPQGSHIPVAPPVPEIIARSIEYNLAHPEQDKSQNARWVPKNLTDDHKGQRMMPKLGPLNA
ncbi:hypothetical protein L9F63_008429, partial [Diploptera punctata]